MFGQSPTTKPAKPSTKNMTAAMNGATSRRCITARHKTIACQRDRFRIPSGLSYLNAAYVSPLSKASLAAGWRGVKRARIHVSLRGGNLRISPHVYNNREDIDRLFDVLRREMA